MRKLILVIVALLPCCLAALAQGDSTFVGTVYNKEYSIYIVLNAKDKNVVVPGQELFGEMAGYIGDQKHSYKWFVLDCEPKSKNAVTLQVSNEEGSEDFEALFTLENDTLYKFRQIDGKTLKIARNGKWQKLPQTITFTRKKP